MHRFPPCPVPDGFPDRARDALEKARPRRGKKAEFKELWKDYRPALAEAQNRKCGFCELRTESSSFGHVEHYRPKGAICVWDNDDDTTWKEIPVSGRIEGRNEVVRYKTGYWWLAYDWNNYLLACGRCNSVWKKNFFPTGDGRWARRATDVAAEQALLLNPFHGPDPREHLSFRRDGTVVPRNGSALGLATLKTVGLNRDDLKEERRSKAEDVFEALHEASRFPDPKGPLGRIHRWGQPKEPFCGMVRAIYEQSTEQPWGTLDVLFPPAPPGGVS